MAVTTKIPQFHRLARHSLPPMTATYWEIDRRIVEHEQSGEARAGMLGNGVTHIAAATDHVN